MIRPASNCKIFILAVVLSFSLYPSLTAQISSIASGNWSSASTWSGGTIPGSGDNVNIQDGHTITVTADAACASITFTGASAALTVNASVTLTVSGTITLRKQANADAACTVSGAGSLSCTNVAVGSADNAPTGNNTTRTHIFTSTISSLTISGNLTINSYFANNNRRRNGSFNLASGAVSVEGSVITNNQNANNTSTFTMASGAQSGTLILTGAAPFSISATGTSTVTLNGTSSLVSYSGSENQTAFSTTYTSLRINNSAGVTLGGNVTVSNTLQMTQGNITTGTSTLAITNSSSGSLVHTSGTMIGKIRRAVNTPLSSDYTFPVGTASFYRPAVLNFSSLSAGTNITAEFIATTPDGFISYTDGGATLNNAFTEGYWRFTSSSLPSATYSLTLTADEFLNFPLDAFARITGRDNGNTTWRALGVHGSLAGDDISRTGVTNLNTTSFDFALATCYTPVFLGFGYERNITIDYTKVAGGSDLYNFPVMVNLAGQDFLKASPAGQIYNANGFDIIFTDDLYNQLDHQLETYDGTNGDLIAWVRIPTLSSSSNTVIKIIYGNPQITSDPSVTSVWDSHYKGIWHLDNNSLNDFTSHNKAGTPYNTPTYPEGMINNSLGLNGTSQYVEVLNAPNINFAGNITVSAWVYMNAGGRDQKIAGNQNNSSGGYKFGIYTNNKVEFEIRNSSNIASLNRGVAGGTVLNTGQWYYLAGISSDVLDSIKTFVNGISERPFKKTGILGVASNTLTISKEPFQSLYYFSGRFDEIRISDKVRSDGWMRTEYFNQSSPSTFYTLDAVGVTTNNLPSEGLCAGPVTLTFGYPAGGTYSGNPYISGNVFTPPSAGTYQITYTYIGGCGPTSITKDLIITETPPGPAAPDREYCSDQITYLEATSGENIRWYSGGTLVSTANPFSTGQTSPGTYNYTVTQTVNGCESSPTAVTLTIYSGITINTQPQPALVCEGDNALFSVAASGYNLTYQWQENGINISDAGIYSGTTTPVLTLTDPGSALSGREYRCVVSASCGSPVNSTAALLTVTPPPVADFSYPGTPYCPNAANPSPVFSGGGVAGTFSSTPGLVFVSTSTGQVDLAASTPGSYAVTNTVAASGGCSEVSATSPFTIISTLTWTGTVSTDWNDPGNWTCGLIPGPTMSVQIANVANKPVLSSGAAGSVNNLTIDAGSSLTVAGNTIQISGTIVNDGSFNAADATVEINGSEAQVIGSGIFTGNIIKDLIINNPSGVTLSGPLNITGIVTAQNGNLATNGNLTLESTSVQTALIDGSGTGTITGYVTMQRYLPSGFGYKYFSSPFQSVTVSELGDDMDLSASFPAVYRYDESRTGSGWVSYTNPAGVMNPLHGYAVNFGPVDVANTVDITGVVNNGSLSRTIYNNNNTYTKGFNLVGNPYPSPIDWNSPSGWTKANVDNALYFFRASDADQYGGTYSTYINGISSDGHATNIIPSMQGFFVHVSDGSYPVIGTLALDNSVRVTDLTRSFMKSGGTDSAPFLRLAVYFADDTASVDPVVIYFDEKASDLFDGNLDALKLMNTDYKVPNIYASGPDGSKLSISALPVVEDSVRIVPLGIRLNRNGNIIFNITDVGETLARKKICLTDIDENKEYKLSDGEECSIFLNSGEYVNRFFLNLEAVATSIPDINTENELFSVYSSPGLLKADFYFDPGRDGLVTICNITGQILMTRRIFHPGYYEFSHGFRDGIYIISFTSGNLRSSRKIFIRSR